MTGEVFTKDTHMHVTIANTQEFIYNLLLI